MIPRPRKKYVYTPVKDIVPREEYDDDGVPVITYVESEAKDLGTIDFYTVEHLRANNITLGLVHQRSTSRMDASKQEDRMIEALESKEFSINMVNDLTNE